MRKLFYKPQTKPQKAGFFAFCLMWCLVIGCFFLAYFDHPWLVFLSCFFAAWADNYSNKFYFGNKPYSNNPGIEKILRMVEKRL